MAHFAALYPEPFMQQGVIGCFLENINLATEEPSPVIVEQPKNNDDGMTLEVRRAAQQAYLMKRASKRGPLAASDTINTVDQPPVSIAAAKEASTNQPDTSIQAKHSEDGTESDHNPDTTRRYPSPSSAKLQPPP